MGVSPRTITFNREPLSMLFIYLSMMDDDAQRSKFENIYHTYYGMIYKIACKVTKNQSLAEDAVHETMVAIIEDIDTIRMDNPKELKSYLYLVTKSKSIDFMRKWDKHKTSLYPADDVPEDNSFDSPDEVALSKITLQKALLALNELPEKYRITLTMKVKGYSIKDIARLTNTSESNVKNRIHRARKYIFDKLK